MARRYLLPADGAGTGLFNSDCKLKSSTIQCTVDGELSYQGSSKPLSKSLFNNARAEIGSTSRIGFLSDLINAGTMPIAIAARNNLNEFLDIFTVLKRCENNSTAAETVISVQVNAHIIESLRTGHGNTIKSTDMLILSMMVLISIQV